MMRRFLDTIMLLRCVGKQLDEGTSYGHWRGESVSAGPFS